MGLAVIQPLPRRGDPERCRPDIDAAGFDRIRAYIGRDHPQPDWPAAIRFAKETFHTVGEKSEADWRRIAEGTFRQGPDGRLHVAWDPRLAKPLERPQAIPDLWRLFRRLARIPTCVSRRALRPVAEATFDRMQRDHPALLRVTVAGVGHIRHSRTGGPQCHRRFPRPLQLKLSARLPVFADIEAAADRLAGQAVATPLLGNPALDATVGGRVLLKPETLQRTGSFKFRGAYNKISRLAAGRTGRAPSSPIPRQSRPGRGRRRGDRRHPRPHRHAGRCAGHQGGEHPRLWRRGRLLRPRHRTARGDRGRIAAERGAVIVPPYDDPDIIAGQGTLGREIALQAAAQGHALDQVLVPCSGGGLVSGCAWRWRRCHRKRGCIRWNRPASTT